MLLMDGFAPNLACGVVLLT